MHLSQKHESNFVPQCIKYVSCKVKATALIEMSLVVDIAFKHTHTSCIQVHYSAYSIKYPYGFYSHCKRKGRMLKVGLLKLIFFEVYCILKCICIRVCPNLIHQQERDSPGLFAFLDLPIYPTLHLQNHSQLLSAILRSFQFHSAVCRRLKIHVTCHHLWMSV